MKQNVGVGTPPENLSAKQCDEDGGKNSKEQILLCWIVLFDPECSERRALCNIFSTHMADCVTAKHTGGVAAVAVAVAAAAVAVAQGCCGQATAV